MTTRRILDFERRIRRWYQSHGRRGLPWRHTHDPYRIFVSEIMLQQTQISRVIPKYREWFRSFPDCGALSRAPFSRVLRAWQGLGYNRRARFLQESARIIEGRFRGALPKKPEILETLPGIGRYSARAISCFAYNRCEPFIETNIRRAIIHTFFPRRKKISDREILSVLRRVEPSRAKREWYWALMDYGSTLPRGKKNPNRRSHSYARQSRFEGSTRYARALIVRLLSQGGAYSERVLRSMLCDAVLMRPYCSSRAFRKILRSLEKDRILMYNKKTWAVAQS